MQRINENNFEETIQNGLCLVDFYADWCMPCKALTPLLMEAEEKLASEGAEIKFFKINVDEAEELSRKFHVMSIPNVILFRDGEKIDGFMGLRKVPEILEFLSQYVGK